MGDPIGVARPLTER